MHSRPARSNTGPLASRGSRRGWLRPLTRLLGVLACGLLATAAGAQPAALKLGAPFTDGAVLQREMKVPVWGWSVPGGRVTVKFAGQSKSATAGKDGKWMLELDPLAASFESAELRVADDRGNTATVRDVLVGEVWMASGQSNMQWIAEKCDVGRVLQKQVAQRVAEGKERAPVIREAQTTDSYAALFPIEQANVQWSNDAGKFSGIAYSFAYHVFREIEVPIGILNCSFSQTAIQAWVPREGFRDATDEYTQSIYRKILQTDPSTPEHRAAWDRFYLDIQETLRQNAEQIKSGGKPRPIPTQPPGNMNGNRDATWMYNGRLSPMVPYAIRGCIWNQGYANMDEGLPYYHNLHSMIRGWRMVWNRPDLPVYFHQFYTPGSKSGTAADNAPTIGSTAEMRLGTWLARDIPHTGMASQIDIAGAIHYVHKSVPGRRLALHALKNQYPAVALKSGGKAADLVADGPMYKSFTLEGDKLVVEFDHAEGGLLVADTTPNAKDGMAEPTVIPGGDGKVTLFYLADENKLWHPATVKIEGSKAVVTSPGVRSPRGVAYGTGGIGFQPNLYNHALLPATPFIVYDQRLVTSQPLDASRPRLATSTWTDGLKIDGVVVDPNSIGLGYEYRKMPLLSSQFVNNAVLQAGQPVTIWGSARHDWGYPAKGSAVIHFSFADVQKEIPVTPEMEEWSVTLPPMKPSAQPHTLKVTFTIDGRLVHERECKNIVLGDVWYVAAPPMDYNQTDAQPDPNVRMMTRSAKRSGHNRPSRFSVSVSTTPDNRFASVWEPATGFAAALGRRIADKTRQPVGVVFMQVVGNPNEDPELKQWIAGPCLDQAPSLADDYQQLASTWPGTPSYDRAARQYIDQWKSYWNDYVPTLIRTRAAPDGKAWGSYPTFASSIQTNAAQTFNVLVESFTPASFKGVVFLTGPRALPADHWPRFGEQMSVLANCWKSRFAGPDPVFFYTLPSAELAPGITRPDAIHGRSHALDLPRWYEQGKEPPSVSDRLIDQIVAKSYP